MSIVTYHLKAVWILVAAINMPNLLNYRLSYHLAHLLNHNHILKKLTALPPRDSDVVSDIKNEAKKEFKFDLII